MKMDFQVLFKKVKHISVSIKYINVGKSSSSFAFFFFKFLKFFKYFYKIYLFSLKANKH